MTQIALMVVFLFLTKARPDKWAELLAEDGSVIVVDDEGVFKDEDSLIRAWPWHLSIIGPDNDRRGYGTLYQPHEGVYLTDLAITAAKVVCEDGVGVPNLRVQIREQIAEHIGADVIFESKIDMVVCHPDYRPKNRTSPNLALVRFENVFRLRDDDQNGK